MAGEFWCIVAVVDGDGVEGLHGVGVVVDGESVVCGVCSCLRPRMSAPLSSSARRVAGRPPIIIISYVIN